MTQSFNTSSSMGRLTLNVLLSFAQFERELIGERVRDKIAASKRKGIWVGGPVPLGYAAVDKKIVVVPAEAEAVRTIFARYLELGSVRARQPTRCGGFLQAWCAGSSALRWCRRRPAARMPSPRRWPNTCDPIPYALETDWPLEEAGFEPLHLGIRSACCRSWLETFFGNEERHDKLQLRCVSSNPAAPG